MKSWPAKDPGEVLDYFLDWSPRDISGDTILTATSTVTKGNVVVDSTSVADLKTRTWLSGGTHGTTCEISIRVTTTNGRTMEETVEIKIKDR